jgi:hypothetical protein
VTLKNPGNILRLTAPAGALKIDMPRHTGAQSTLIILTLELAWATEEGTGFAELRIICRQSLTDWPGGDMTGSHSGYYYAFDTVRAATTSDGGRCLVVGDTVAEFTGETDPTPFVFARIREAVLWDPEDAYLDVSNWVLSMITDDTGLTYSNDDIYLSLY